MKYRNFKDAGLNEVTRSLTELCSYFHKVQAYLFYIIRLNCNRSLIKSEELRVVLISFTCEKLIYRRQIRPIRIEVRDLDDKFSVLEEVCHIVYYLSIHLAQTWVENCDR